MASFYAVVSAGRWWHGPEKDGGVCWGSAGQAWITPSRRAAQSALDGLVCPSAAKAEVVAAPAAALVGGAPQDASDGAVAQKLRWRGKTLRLRLR